MDRNVMHLHPWMRPVLERHQAVARTIGLRTKQFETYRDISKQREFYNRGRDPLTGEIIDSGAVITDAMPGTSYHNITQKDGSPASLAYHLGILLPDGGIYGFGESKLGPAGIYVLTGLGMIGEQLGLRWGGRWSSHDYTHFEFCPTKGMDIIKVADWVRAGKPLTQIHRV